MVIGNCQEQKEQPHIHAHSPLLAADSVFSRFHPPYPYLSYHRTFTFEQKVWNQLNAKNDQP